MRKWYKKVSVQVAIVTGFFSIVVALISILKHQETTIVIPTPQNTMQQNYDTKSKKDESLIENKSHSSKSILKEDNLQKHDNDLILSNELKTKSLERKLVDARNYLRSGNIENKEKSIQLYREIINELSLEARAELDQKLLIEADIAYKKSQNDDSARKYSALFSKYYNN
ncbi:MAG: hypothetical protein PVH88_13870 [Ignavibacteria bacterium]|jgi:hypothetical protein